MCNKVAFVSVSDWYKTQEVCDKDVSKEHLILKYCLDRRKTQKLSNKAVVACLLALKFVPDWVATSKILEILDDIVFSNKDIDLADIDSDIVTFFCDDACLKNLHLANINVDDDNFDDDDPETRIHVKLLALSNKNKQRKALS